MALPEISKLWHFYTNTLNGGEVGRCWLLFSKFRGQTQVSFCENYGEENETESSDLYKNFGFSLPAIFSQLQHSHCSNHTQHFL